MADLHWSIFGSKSADRILRTDGEWPELITSINNAGPFSDKVSCPWVKLAKFGDNRSAHNSLRHDANVVEIYGIEGDYDLEVMSPEDAIAKLEAAQITAVVYTSPSHTAEKPRWRVLAPLSVPTMPDARYALLARINGVLGGILSGESFTLSQSYYFGRVKDIEYKVLVTFDDPSEGHFIDLLTELDEIAIGKPDKPQKYNDEDSTRWQQGELAEKSARLGRKLRTGDNRHQMLVRAANSISAQGVRDVNTVLLMLEALVQKYFDHADPPAPGALFSIAEHAVQRDVKNQQNAEKMVNALIAEFRFPVAAPADIEERIAAFDAAQCQHDSAVDEFFDLPGEMGVCMAWMLRTSMRPQPLLAMVATISLFATALSTKIMSPTGLRTNLYFVGVAGTSAGKDHGRKCLAQALQDSHLESLIGGDEIASGAGLLSRVAVCPRTVFQLDEFGLMLQAMRSKNAGSHLASIVRYLMQLYGSTGSVFRGAEYADQKARARSDIEYPCVNLHATTTPDQFFKALGSSDVTSGALNRIMVVVVPDATVPRQEPDRENTPISLVQWIEQVQRLQGQDLKGLTPGNPLDIRFAAAAKSMISAFGTWLDEYSHEHKDTPQIPALWGRAYEFAVKMAMIHAMARYSDPASLDEIARNDGLCIPESSMGWAIRFTRHFVGLMEIEVAQRMGDSEFDILVTECTRVIKKSGPRGLTSFELSRKCAAYKAQEPRYQDNIHEALQRREDASQRTFQPQSGRGKPRVAWVATEFIVEVDVTDSNKSNETGTL